MNKKNAIILGMMIATGLSFLIMELSFAVTVKLCQEIDSIIPVYIGNFILVSEAIISGTLCYILLFVIEKFIKKKFHTIKKEFYISLCITAFIYAVASGIYFDRQESFGYIAFFIILFRWNVTGFLYFFISMCHNLYQYHRLDKFFYLTILFAAINIAWFTCCILGA